MGEHTSELYQARIANSVEGAIQTGRSGVVLAPTGSGKSFLVAFASEDALRHKKPVLILHPDISLLRQNYAQIRRLPALEAARTAFFVAKNETVGDGPMLRDTLDADVIAAINMSLVNKLDDGHFLNALERFGKRGGVVVIDEGQKAAADELARVLSRIALAGGSAASSSPPHPSGPTARIRLSPSAPTASRT
ncbi:DEAD/DEAH box helicase [Microvirga rosea]|uniref:DEAD/DEAH box helicase n=1 Tax=Microvirga rosea TaxID=2715425 RepID=UPI001D0B298C|nr:DEAD/DEAH box helicase [Microvirga rosea]MCB8823162.1 DEAD/DEAH box helicase family protein [Microvirga rosea]